LLFVRALVAYYAGKVWSMHTVVDVRLTTLNGLSEFGIPARTINSIRSKRGAFPDESAELILFFVL
jgi:hypothetical protein